MTNVPSAFVPIQQPAVTFNQPVSENMLQSMAGAVNGLLGILLPVGSIIASMLDEPTFQDQLPGPPSPMTWVLADGRNVAGSTYATVTGSSTIPDLRGQFLRASNNGGSSAGTRTDGKQNPDGVLAPGTYTADKLDSHSHTITDPGHDHALAYNQGPPISDYGDDLICRYGTVGGSNIGALQQGIALDGYDPDQITSSTTGISVNTTGGNETAPKNYTINFFIRIN